MDQLELPKTHDRCDISKRLLNIEKMNGYSE
jgi:hypothetical protein